MIKVFRRQLAEKRFDNIEEYAADFLRFPCANSDVFPDSLRDAHTTEIITHLVVYIRARLAEELDSTAEQQDGLNDSDIALISHRVRYVPTHSTPGRWMSGGSAPVRTYRGSIRSGS